MEKKANEFTTLYDEYRSRETVGLLKSTHLTSDARQHEKVFEDSLQPSSEGFSVGQQIGISKGNGHFFLKQSK